MATASTSQPSIRRAAGAPFTPNRPRWFQRVAAWGLFTVEHLLTASLRCEWRDLSGLSTRSRSSPVIFCLWHNRLAFSMLVHRRYARKLTALVSASKDGALLAAVLNKFQVDQVRGSSSRRGPQALLELTSHAEQGSDLAITPDGPKGPRYIVQKGVIGLAQVTGLPIVAVSCNSRWKFCLKSWDGFQIPIPFSRCQLILNEPIMVPRDADDTEKERLRQMLEQTLSADTRD